MLTGRGTLREFWAKVGRWLVMVLLFPIVPVMAAAGSGGGGGEGAADSEEEGDADSEEEEGGDQDDTEWKPERAMATIRNLRQQERTLTKELKTARAGLKGLQAADEERKRKGLTDLEKAQGDLSAAQERTRRLESELLDLRLRQGFYDAVAGAKLEFVSPKAREAAFVLALAELEAGDDGKVNGPEVVKVLQKEHGYLFGSGQKAPDIDGGKRGKGKESHDSERIRAKYGI